MLQPHHQWSKLLFTAHSLLQIMLKYAWHYNSQSSTSRHNISRSTFSKVSMHPGASCIYSSNHHSHMKTGSKKQVGFCFLVQANRHKPLLILVITMISSGKGVSWNPQKTTWNLCFGIPAKKQQHSLFAGILWLFHAGMFQLYMEPKRTAPNGSNPEVPGLRSRTSLFFLGGEGECSAFPSIFIFEDTTFDQGWVHPMV